MRRIMVEVYRRDPRRRAEAETETSRGGERGSRWIPGGCVPPSRPRPARSGPARYGRTDRGARAPAAPGRRPCGSARQPSGAASARGRGRSAAGPAALRRRRLAEVAGAVVDRQRQGSDQRLAPPFRAVADRSCAGRFHAAGSACARGPIHGVDEHAGQRTSPGKSSGPPVRRPMSS